ncbi:MAG TPA: branched-chain amino acid ABC transporter permease [Aestuariivirgaceae bacterium]|jgi:branched-chain amino acid transport system permease protein
MSYTLLAVQALNGLQFGVLLFLIASGLTLVFGVMNFLNLAHGALFMVGAYLAVFVYQQTGAFFLAVVLGLVAALIFALMIEVLVLRHFYRRDHLAQLLATFGLILILNDGSKAIWGSSPQSLPLPEILSGSVPLIDNLQYPLYRLIVIGVGLVVALFLYLIVQHTRFGMLVRAGAADSEMVSALGVDVRRLFMTVFAAGAVLAALAGILAAPLIAIEPGMGDNVLILAFVVIVIGGAGSIRGAFVAALLVGLVDTLGRSFVTDLFRVVLPPASANEVGPAIASILIYALMALVLVFRPAGLFPAPGRS